ncbi:MAG: ATP-binding protein [Pseudoramibacter sp.]
MKTNKKIQTPQAVIEAFLNQRSRHLFDEHRRIQSLEKRIPELADLKRRRDLAGTALVRARLKGDPNAKAAYDQTLAELQTRKAALLQENGLTPEDLAVHYWCPDCQDTGYRGGAPCHCLVQALTDAAFSRFDLRPQARNENFDTFNLAYYPDEKPAHGPSPRAYMGAMKTLMMRWCDDFDRQTESFLFYGRPGLGKTFLSNCVANALIARQKNVIYITSEHLIDLVRDNIAKSGGNALYASLLDCDLLIIDDLGAEYQTAFSDDQLFQIINDRILGGDKMLISSNLTPKDIQSRYNTRLASRMTGYFKALRFTGNDIRMLKKQTALRSRT